MQGHRLKSSRAQMKNQIPEQIKEARSQKMLELSKKMNKQFCDSYKGRTVTVLVEEKLSNGKYHATLPNYMDVYISSKKDISNSFIDITL